MPKLPDFSGLTKKLDIQGLVDSVKSAVGGSSTPPKAPEGDEVAAKFVEIITLTHNLINTQSEQAKIIATVNTKLNALYKDLQLLREATNAAAPIAPTKTAVEDTLPEQNPPTKEEENK